MARVNPSEISKHNRYTWTENIQGSIAVVVANFNHRYTQQLEAGADAFLNEIEFSVKRVIKVKVPGSLELPWMCQQLIVQKKVKGVVAIGVVIKGDTYHFEMVSEGVTMGLLQVSLKTGVPVTGAVLTCYNLLQVKERCKGSKNKGYEAMQALFDSLEALHAC